jgi:sterol 3beta-glucosyltransferase
VVRVARDVLVVTGDVPHQRLFPRCAAVVHHAGAGTTHTALAAGVVGVPVPFWADQPFWSARTAALGVSVDPVPKRRWSRVRLARAIARAVGEPWRVRRALEVGESVRSEAGRRDAARRIMALEAGARLPCTGAD